MKCIIHVNQHKIKENCKLNKCDPVITVKTYNSNIYAKEVNINGPSRVCYTPDDPLNWMEMIVLNIWMI